jgi:hypothetical protein
VNGQSRGRGDAALRALRERGLLLLADNTLPSLSRLIADEPIRGSWWGHPKAHAIFRAARGLEEHPDVIAIPLIAGKITFIHRRLWPALLTVAVARDRCQIAGLSAGARRLLRRLDAAGELRTTGPSVRELERRLLAKAKEIHTETGAHAKAAERWERWARRARVEPLADVEEARRVLEETVEALTPRGCPRPKLPWMG